MTIALALAAATGGCRREKSAPLPAVDRPLELLARPTLTGPDLDVAALRGKVVVVLFWSPS